jgi:hypothetical protein
LGVVVFETKRFKENMTPMHTGTRGREIRAEEEYSSVLKSMKAHLS